jgi:7-cyano-7-deazaguanine synthase in queuosine biosynthesis
MRFIESDKDIRMIVMWSGGIDSTFKLAYLLNETERQVHAHHVHIVNREGRHKTERAACRALRSKLKAIRGFVYTESRIDHRQHDRIPFDMAIVAFEAGVVARSGDGRNSEPFTHWTIGTHKAEGHYQRRFDLYEPMVNALCFPNDYPVFEMGKVVTKEEEITYLDGLGLFTDCWYCRTPKAGRPCSTCGTCDEVKQARRAIRAPTRDRAGGDRARRA